MSITGELTSALGPTKVLLDEPTLAAYAVDEAPVLDYQLPLAVVFAESVEDVQATVRACAARGVPLVARGAGSCSAWSE
jgi:glycolate oxidase